MIPIETLAPFFAAAILLALAPGPDNIFVLTQSALRGKGAGLTVTLGLCTGLIAHTSAVAFGVAAVFQASRLAFTIVKLVGAAYLLYLAWGAFRASAQTAAPAEGPRSRPLRGLYLRGIVMNVTNPKVSIFFLAFLPQFTDPGRGRLTWQFLTLGSVFIVATLLVFGAVAVTSGAIGERVLASPRAQKIVNRVAGAVFAGLALKLAFAHR